MSRTLYIWHPVEWEFMVCDGYKKVILTFLKFVLAIWEVKDTKTDYRKSYSEKNIF